MDPNQQRQLSPDPAHHVGLHRLPVDARLSRNGGNLPAIGQRGTRQRTTGKLDRSLWTWCLITTR